MERGDFLNANISPEERTGVLLLKIKTGLGIYPVPMAMITVSSEAGEKSDIMQVVYTDSAGIAPPITLPAGQIGDEQPDSEGLLTPNTYSVEVDRAGYYGAVRYGVPVFPGIVSEQTIYLTPLPESNGLPTIGKPLRMIENRQSEEPNDA